MKVYVPVFRLNDGTTYLASQHFSSFDAAKKFADAVEKQGGNPLHFIATYRPVDTVEQATEEAEDTFGGFTDRDRAVFHHGMNVGRSILADEVQPVITNLELALATSASSL
jgi:hypothetical protein